MAVYNPTTLAPAVDDNKLTLLRKIDGLFAGSANGRAPITVTGLGPPPSPLAQIDFNADKASFTGGANGYTGSADLDSFQREVTTNTLRNGHFFGAGNTTGPCVILETSPTLCVLVAPGNLVASANGDGTVDVSWDDIPITANRAAFNWRLVGDAITGWTSSGTATGFSTSPSAGTYQVEVRAVSTSGVAGITATSAPFTVTSAPVGSPLITSAGVGLPRNDFAGELGCKFLVGGAPITIAALGRIFITGNSQTHAVSLYDALSNLIATVGVDCSTGSNDQYNKSPITSQVLLTGVSYIIASTEANGGDTWKDSSFVSTDTGITLQSAVFRATGDPAFSLASGGECYVPPNLFFT